MTSNILVPVVKIGTTFIMAPVIVKALGNYDYGIWAIVFSVVGYMGLLDMGMQPAIVRYVAKYHALKDNKELMNIYSTSLLFLGIIGALICIFFIGWAFIDPQLLAGHSQDVEKYTYFLLIVGMLMINNFTGAVFDCFLQGLQRYDIRSAVTILNTIVGNAIAYVLLTRGGGLLTLALTNGIGFSLKSLIYWYILARPGFGAFRFEKRNVSLKSLKELAAFAYKSLIQGISSTISLDTDSIVIGAFLGPIIVTYYVIPSNFISQIRNLVWSLTTPFMPLFSDIDAYGDSRKTEQVFIVASRYTLGLIFPLMGGAYFLGLPFLARWMGPQYAANGRWVLYILLAAYMVPWINPLSNRFLTGTGYQGILAKTGLVSATLNLGLSLLLVRRMGKEGVALGTMIASIIFTPFVLKYTCRRAGIDIWHYLRSVLGPLTMPAFAFLATLWVLSARFELKNYTSIFLSAVISVLVYAFFFAVFGIKREEQRYIVGKIRAIFA